MAMAAATSATVAFLATTTPSIRIFCLAPQGNLVSLVEPSTSGGCFPEVTDVGHEVTGWEAPPDRPATLQPDRVVARLPCQTWVRIASRGLIQKRDPMPIPTPDEIRQFYGRYYELWNSHDREGFINNWTEFVTDISTEEPIGAPVKTGFQDAVIDAWDSANGIATMTLDDLIICGNEAAMVMTNHVTVGDAVVNVRLVQTIRYEQDGSVHLRNWF